MSKHPIDLLHDRYYPPAKTEFPFLVQQLGWLALCALTIFGIAAFLYFK